MNSIEELLKFTVEVKTAFYRQSKPDIIFIITKIIMADTREAVYPFRCPVNQIFLYFNSNKRAFVPQPGSIKNSGQFPDYTLFRKAL